MEGDNGMLNDAERDEYCRDSFNILSKVEGYLPEEKANTFLKVKDFLDHDIVDQIETFKATNKGILLIGGNYDLLSGVAGYIWYTHPLVYFSDDDPSHNYMWKRGRFWHRDFRGFNSQEIRECLFSQPDGLMNVCKYEKILFLRDVNIKYIEILERIGRIIRNSIPSIQDCELVISEKSFKSKVSPSIIIINVKQKNELTEEFLQQFEIINLELNRESKPSKTFIVPSENGMEQREGPLEKASAEPDNVRNETADRQQDRNIDPPRPEETIKLTLYINKGIVDWNGNRLQTIKDKDFAILLALAKRTGEPVKNDNLYAFINSTCNAGVLLNQRISAIRKAFPAPYNDLNQPQCIIPDAKRKKGYRRLNLTKDQVEII